MKITMNTIGVTEGKWLNISHNLISGGIVITAVGLLATFAGRLISTRSSSWIICHDPVAVKQVGDIFVAFDEAVKNSLTKEES